MAKHKVNQPKRKRRIDEFTGKSSKVAKTSGCEKYRSPRRMVGVPKELADIAGKIAERNFTDMTAECVRFIREGLVREGWLKN